MESGYLKNELITEQNPQYSLKNKICPTFQNEGTATVYIDGRTLKTGESFSVNAPNIVLENAIPISFEPDTNKTRLLYIGYIELVS